MYNRYIPGAGGVYERRQVPEPKPPCPPEQAAVLTEPVPQPKPEPCSPPKRPIPRPQNDL